jgi:hypothetical protein
MSPFKRDTHRVRPLHERIEQRDVSHRRFDPECICPICQCIGSISKEPSFVMPQHSRRRERKHRRRIPQNRLSQHRLIWIGHRVHILAGKDSIPAWVNIGRRVGAVNYPVCNVGIGLIVPKQKVREDARGRIASGFTLAENELPCEPRSMGA